jgi:hypothetical protein
VISGAHQAVSIGPRDALMDGLLLIPLEREYYYHDESFFVSLR